MADPAPGQADLCNFSLTEGQIFLPLQGVFHDFLIFPAVRLGPEAVDGGALTPVQQAVLDAGGVRRPGHFAPQGVQLPDQVAFSCASDGGVAGHVAYGVQVDGKTDGFLPQPRRSQGGFNAGVACADDGDIVFSGGKFLHWDFFLRRLRRRGGVFSSIGPGPARPRTPRLLLPRGKSRQKRA